MSSKFLINFFQVLVSSFVEFDQTLVERPVVEELKILANKGKPLSEHDPTELNDLCETASMPIEEVRLSSRNFVSRFDFLRIFAACFNLALVLSFIFEIRTSPKILRETVKMSKIWAIIPNYDVIV